MKEVIDTTKGTQIAYDVFVNEIKKCVSGAMGWVDCSIKRSKRIGIDHSNLTGVATALGLKIVRHGKYGYIATK